MGRNTLAVTIGFGDGPGAQTASSLKPDHFPVL
jgi:hypothetical protein